MPEIGPLVGTEGMQVYQTLMKVDAKPYIRVGNVPLDHCQALASCMIGIDCLKNPATSKRIRQEATHRPSKHTCRVTCGNASNMWRLAGSVLGIALLSVPRASDHCRNVHGVL